jgi:hypothetical protein
VAVSAIYGACTTKRARRTKTAVEQLERQILDVLEEDHPQSIRHVFYRMTDPRLREPVEKTELGYRTVQNRLKRMRRAGVVRYDRISDSIRRGYHTITYASGADFLRQHIGAYRADLWADAEHYVEVWCESRSIAGSIVDLCQELAVSLYPAGGFASITFAYEAPDFIRETVGCTGKPAHVLYIGDHDPAGVLIDRSLEAEFRQHLDTDTALTFHRIAITEEQIAEFDLPTKPRKDGDRRARHVEATVEAEAMPAGILRELLRAKIESFLPSGALEVARVAEQSERAALRRWANLIEGSAP